MDSMNNMSGEQKKGAVAGAAIVAAVIGLALGFGGAKLIENKDESTSSAPVSATVPTSDTKAADLRAVLNGLEREHVDLAATATRAGFNGAPDFAAAATAVDNNSIAISQAVGSVYGDAAATKFLEIWRSHVTFFVNYTVAAKKADKPGMDKAVSDLGGYVDAISDFFSTANPNLPRDAVKQLITEHVGLLKGTVDAYGAKDYTGSFAKEHEANVQIGKVADAIAGAIVKQNPSKF